MRAGVVAAATAASSGRAAVAPALVAGGAAVSASGAGAGETPGCSSGEVREVAAANWAAAGAKKRASFARKARVSAGVRTAK